MRMTNYAHMEKPNPYNVRMYIPSMNAELNYTQYCKLVRTMGLIKDPANLFFIGGWPVYNLPDGTIFQCE
jgi:hypothetical protein